MSTRVLVVEHQENAGLGQLEARLREHELELVRVGPDAGVEIPERPEAYDGIIVLGGSMGPKEDDVAPWLPSVRRLLQNAVSAKVPTLGICLGAQLLVTALGAHVRTMPDGPEIGLCEVSLNAAAGDDPLFGVLAEQVVPVVQWHYLEAEDLPAHATHLGSSPACRNQIFRIGETAWGVQFHPEALGNTARDWVDEDRQGVAELGLDEAKIIADVDRAEPQLAGVWLPLMDRFAALAKTHAEAQER